MTLYQRAAVCAIKYGAYALAYLAHGDTMRAAETSGAAKRLTDLIGAEPANEDDLRIALWIAEAGLAALDATLVD